MEHYPSHLTPALPIFLDRIRSAAQSLPVHISHPPATESADRSYGMTCVQALRMYAPDLIEEGRVIIE